MQLVAINWHVYLLTRSPLALGAVGLVRVVPIVLCSLVGGVVLWQLARAGTLRERIVRALTAAVPAIVLQGVWVLRTVHRAGPSAIRQISVILITFSFCAHAVRARNCFLRIRRFRG